MGDPANKHATGLAIGSLARALYEKDAVALVRFVRRQNAEPEMGILSPFIDVDVNLLQFCQVNDRGRRAHIDDMTLIQLHLLL